MHRSPSVCLPMWALCQWPNEEANGEWNSTVQRHEAILLPRARTVSRLSSRSQFTTQWHKTADQTVEIVKPSVSDL